MEVSMDEMLLLVGAKEVEIAKMRMALADTQNKLSAAESELAKLRPAAPVSVEGNDSNSPAAKPQ